MCICDAPRGRAWEGRPREVTQAGGGRGVAGWAMQEATPPCVGEHTRTGSCARYKAGARHIMPQPAHKHLQGSSSTSCVAAHAHAAAEVG